MRFEWDENKRLINLQRHGIDFADVWEVFADDTFVVLDDRYDYGETRFVTFGIIAGEVVAVVNTDNGDVIRVISIRKATKNEQIIYFNEIRN
jgi:uncharacterized protein